MSKHANVITAIGTPLDAEEHLHEEGLRRHLDDQWLAGIDGILVAGTMGAMQMLRDETYRTLVARATELSRGKGEVLVGVGDAGWARTRDRIDLVGRYKPDGVVVLTPYLFRFSQHELVDYFTALASASPLPLYLYDLPSLTGVSLTLETYQAIARHPNIRGAKVSGRLTLARQLMECIGDDLRIIVAEPDRVEPLLREGVAEHLDGMFAIAPQWIKGIVSAAAVNDWPLAAAYQAKLNELRAELINSASVMGAFTVMMNARGIPGRFHGAPYASLDERQRDALCASAVMRSLTSEASAA